MILHILIMIIGLNISLCNDIIYSMVFFITYIFLFIVLYCNLLYVTIFLLGLTLYDTRRRTSMWSWVVGGIDRQIQAITEQHDSSSTKVATFMQFCDWSIYARSVKEAGLAAHFRCIFL